MTTTSVVMIHSESKETKQNNEASLRCLSTQDCLNSKPFHYNSQGAGNGSERFPQDKVEKNSRAGGFLESEYSLNMETSAPQNEGYNRPFYFQEFRIWPHYYAAFQKPLQNQLNTYENPCSAMNRGYPFPVDNVFQYLPSKMYSQSYLHGYQSQEFHYFVVIDFEATCDKESIPYPQEIIEFPSVLVNSSTGQIEGWFQTYVRPSYHQHLSDFCKELTGIQQIQVDRGLRLSEALLEHDKWLEGNGIKQKNFAVVTWSNWDCRVMLESECSFKRIRKPPYFNRWINLRVPFHEVFGDVRCNLREAVEMAGLTWEGRAHCGLDDALNTARLLCQLMHRGLRFSITDSLVLQIPPDSCIDLGQQTQKLKETVGPAMQPHSLPFIPIRKGCCFCGVKSSKCGVPTAGTAQVRFFFACGNWAAARRAMCSYFEWAS